MATPSKFTEETRAKILQALQVGASRRTAAHIAGVDEAQVRRWIDRGKGSAEGTSYHDFYMAAMEAEASPRLRALGVIYKEMPDNPVLAWKFIERREPGYAPPMFTGPTAPAGPVVVQLSFSNRAPLALAPAEVLEGDVIEGEVVEQDDEPGTHTAGAT